LTDSEVIGCTYVGSQRRSSRAIQNRARLRHFPDSQFVATA